VTKTGREEGENAWNTFSAQVPQLPIAFGMENAYAVTAQGVPVGRKVAYG
jgi:hypothetical protein